VLDGSTFPTILRFFVDRGYLSTDEAGLVSNMFAPGFIFADTLSIAESVHVQVKVHDTAVLPHDEFLASGVTETREMTNFRKYKYPNGLAVIFTSGPIAEEDLVPGAVSRALPSVDHFGIDLREDSPAIRSIYAAIPTRAVAAGWRHVRQGGPQAPVRGCQCEVPEKSWVSPPDGPDGRGRPIEFAFGELEIMTGDVGCDYRPIDPAHPLARLVPRTPQPRAPQTITIVPRPN